MSLDTQVDPNLCDGNSKPTKKWKTQKPVRKFIGRQIVKMTDGPVVEDYIYEPLNSPTAIRILELLPGDENDPIRCQLFITNREKAPQYEALSYVWGDPTNKCEVACGDGKVEIPKNLRNFLRRVRDPKKIRHLWADSLCINQSNEKERGHQVRQMASIYSAAERVLVWLGRGDPFKDFDENEQLSLLVRRFYPPTYASSASDNHHLTLLYPDGISETFEKSDTCTFWTAFSKLTKKSWFKRLWIVQEAGLARSALVLFGNREIDFDELMSVLNDLISQHPGTASYYRLNYALNQFWIFPNRVPTSWGRIEWDFLDVLYFSSDQRASDPRDYVYALLGHPSAKVSDVLIVDPDYEKYHLEIFHELAIKLIKQTRKLRVLCAVRHVTQDDINKAFPSWVPIWSKQSLATSIGVLTSNLLLFDADAGFPAQFKFPKNTRALQARGCILGTINDITNELEKNPKRNSPGQPYIKDWLIDDAMNFGGMPMESTQEKLSALLAVLTRGWYDADGDREQGLKDFAAFRLHLSTRRSSGNSPLPTCGFLPEGRALAEETARGGSVQNFLAKSEGAVFGKRLFTATRGMFGMGPAVLRSGDVCCILFGSYVPIILRPVGTEYKVIGPAYIYGVMQGEAIVDLVLGDKYREQTFNII